MPREATLRIVTGRHDNRPSPAPEPARRPPTFDTLYREHYPRVLGLCRRLLRHTAQAEDAAQEVFMRAYRAFDDYDGAQPFAPWVLKISGNYCVDLLRRRAKEAELFGNPATEMGDVESDDPSAIAGLISAENAAEVRAAIDRLPDKHRVPLVLAYYNESSYDDIAATLGITRNHVGVLLLRGKQALRSRLLGSRAQSAGSTEGEST
jgi:RNA polymerase sigma-70 factor, ECF subfamily